MHSWKLRDDTLAGAAWSTPRGPLCKGAMDLGMLSADGGAESRFEASLPRLRRVLTVFESDPMRLWGAILVGQALTRSEALTTRPSGRPAALASGVSQRTTGCERPPVLSTRPTQVRDPPAEFLSTEGPHLVDLRVWRARVVGGASLSSAQVVKAGCSSRPTAGPPRRP
jgi:hypothetical protein